MKIQELSVSKEGKQILAPVDLEIESSFFLAVVGANGAGKSTFLKCLLKQERYSGSINLPYTDNEIGYLAQSQNLSFDLLVKDIVVMGLYSNLKLLENYTTQHYEKVKEVLRTLQIEDLYEQSYKVLSGGEKQLVWLAQTLINNPKLIILDEPTSSLDIYNKVKLLKTLSDLHMQRDISIIIVTHDLYLLKEINGSILHIKKDGAKLSQITPEIIDSFC